jgi:hypothetical protein
MKAACPRCNTVRSVVRPASAQRELEHVIPGGRGPNPGTVAWPRRRSVYVEAITTDRHCRWNTDERQWRRQSIARVLSSVGFSTQSTRMQAQCPSGNTSQYCVSSLREEPRNEDRANRKHLILRRLLNAPGQCLDCNTSTSSDRTPLFRPRNARWRPRHIFACGLGTG